MAETTSLERTYTIPLRKAWMKVPNYKRARKGVVAIKAFIARHMNVPHRDVAYVKLDMYLNNELWFRGPKHSPSKVTVKATKKGEIVHVSFVEVPSHVHFAQVKHDKFHKKTEKKETKTEEKKEEKTEEQKKAEEEKEKSAAIVKEQQMEQQTKAEKHTTKVKTAEIKRMALKK